ncbi:NAD(+) diphosphatase [Prolixibacter denitrificans]|uniref:NAD(+) diphosphatase n=1 Tax=Prolixibacter denitrificans TaxID=1541063 RepID=A0A2P8CF81_9BACT|nr:NAD(+) diphosphatase [Prolixibacter denitrificans]PSK83634.1 NAD+ diphosphatase [Prolixibacter denitrificans]GET23182.1 NADH pyrophosphatase [Prolixibacter denitrificans]
MIQDIFPHRFDNQYRAEQHIGDEDIVLCYRDNTLLLKTDGETFGLPRKKDFPEISEQTESTFLFSLNDVSCFLVWDELAAKEPDFAYQEISFFRTIEQPEIAWVSIAGLHLVNWYTQNRFCGKCGSRTEHKSNERALVCPNCHTTVYPKISPAIIVAIVSGDKLLLARNANFRGNWFSLIAGYVDVGETLEEALAREVKEEVGLDVTNIQYYKSQPWPLSGSMMIGFVAEADEHQPIRVDGNEIVEAAWFSRGNLPNHSSTISIAGEMIAQFEKGELQGCGAVKKVSV